MRDSRKRWIMLGSVSSLVLLSVAGAPAQEVQTGPTVIQEVNHDTSPPLREIPYVAPRLANQEQELSIRRPMPPHISATTEDAVLQRITGPLVGTTNLLNFDGVNARDGVAPPDTNAAVGATQAVETVNLSYQVYDKNSGSSLLGPAEVSSIWTGFNGACGTDTGFSDPVVLYDKAAGRWLISIVAFNGAFTAFEECVAVSKTSDATGAYNRYDFSFGLNLNDYPKFGIWPDAYYMSTNIFLGGGAFSGPQACAMDRTNMLAGNAATMQCFQKGTSDFSLLPSDLDGSTAPPASSPNFFIELKTSTTLNLFKFHVDFTTPSNTTFTGPTPITVSSFTDACGANGTCIPQKNTTQKLDSLGDRLMFRLAYRNFGDHEAIVATHSITSGTSTGVRWYEIRSPNGTPAIFQSGTFAPDTNFRWMPSIGMDQAGDIVIGYSESGGSSFPSIFYTGRVPSDTPGTMETEASIKAGLGSQNGGLSRWGDYTSVAIDPSDDCTFWHANEYLAATGSFNWNTRLASFKFPSCGSTTPDFTLTATPASETVVQGGSTTYTATIAALNGFTGTVTFSASGLPSGATASFSPPSVTTSGSSTMTVTTLSTTPTGSFTITITGTSGSTVHTTTVTLVVTSTADFTISATPASLSVARGSRGTYTVTITAVGGFNGTVTLSVSGQGKGTTARFSKTTVTGSGTSILRVTPSLTATTGTFTLTITGTSGTLVHTTTVTLAVT